MDKQTNQDTTSQEESQGGNAPANIAMPVSRTTVWHQLVHTGMHLLWKYKAIWLLCIGLFFIVGVPLIINELYKHPGYVTIWSAADVLSYYGAVLGASITVGTLAVTIFFTRKQLLRESYLKNREESWSKIEDTFITTLKAINPILPLKESMDNGQVEPSKAIIIFQRYSLACQTVIDELIAYLDHSDYLKVKDLIDQITISSKQFIQIADEEIAVYRKLQTFNGRTLAQQTIDVESKYPGSFPEEQLSFCRELLQDTDNLSYEIFSQDIGRVNAKLVTAYENSYRLLLAQKRDIFEKIDNEVQKEADSILHLWRK